VIKKKISWPKSWQVLNIASRILFFKIKIFKIKNNIDKKIDSNKTQFGYITMLFSISSLITLQIT
jgi:hypothetical protein